MGVAIKGPHDAGVGILVVVTMLYLDCMNINVLVVTLCYSFARCSHRGKPGKAYIDLSVIIS